MTAKWVDAPSTPTLRTVCPTCSPYYATVCKTLSVFQINLCLFCL